MASSRSTEVISAVVSTSPALLSLCLALECREAGIPELLQKRLQLQEPLRSRLVEALGAVASLAHQPRLLQDGQMLGDRGPGHVEVRRDVPGGQLALADERQDLPSPGRCDRSERGLHGYM